MRGQKIRRRFPAPIEHLRRCFRASNAAILTNPQGQVSARAYPEPPSFPLHAVPIFPETECHAPLRGIACVGAEQFERYPQIL